MRYAIVIEKAQNNYSAYVPDLPGCLATGAMLEKVEAQIREAIEFHIAGLREDGMPIPQSSSRGDYVKCPHNNAIERSLRQLIAGVRPVL
jgi:predicted RNase H-like HicB family nuclease